MQIVVDDVLVQYEKQGSGPPLLLLHGWGDSKETFRKLIHELGSGYTYILVDLPGFGGSESPKETFTLEKYSIFVSNLLKKVDIDSLFAVIGHSNGGAIAIKAIAKNVITSEKLVLIASSGVRQRHNPKSKLLRLVAKVAKVPIYFLPKPTQLMVKKKTYTVIGSDLFVAEHLQDTFREVVREDLREESKKIKIPALLLYGGHDYATPVSYGTAFSKNIEKSELQIFEDAGHFIHHSHTKEIAETIKKFLVKK